MQYERYISDQKEILSEMYDEYEHLMIAQLDDVDALIENCVTVVEDCGDLIADTIEGTADTVGYIMQDGLEQIVAGLRDLATSLDGTLQSLVQSTISTNVADYETAYTQTGSTSGITAQMKANSLAWWTATSTSEQNALHNQNTILADELSAVTGETNFNSKNGVWYDSQGNPLYSLSTDEIVSAIVSRMKSNSASWNSSGEAERTKLSNDNVELASRIQSLTGESVTRDSDGVWWIGGRQLYEAYHSGGVVGGGTLQENEELAVLQKGEAVITNEQLQELSSALSDGVVTALNSVVETMLAGANFGSGDSAAMLHALNTQRQGQSTNNFDIEIEMPNVTNYEEFMNQMSADNKFERLVQALTLDAAAGKSTMVKRNIRW